MSGYPLTFDGCQVAKKAAPPPVRPPLSPAKAQLKAWEVLAPDGMRTFVGRKAHKVWLWMVVERARQRIVGRTPGRQTEALLHRRCGMPQVLFVQ